MPSASVVLIGEDVYGIADRVPDWVTVTQVTDFEDAAAAVVETTVDYVVVSADYFASADLTAVYEAAGDVPLLVYTTEEPDLDQVAAYEGVIDVIHAAGGDVLVHRLEARLIQRGSVDYPVSSDEAERLRVIEDLDIERFRDDPVLANLAELAGQLLSAERAFIGIVGRDVEEFLACEGFNLDELDRDNTVCTFTITEDDIFEVSDVSTDPRFQEVQKLSELDINWYAGAQITSPSGHHIGAFCLIDGKTRELDERQRAILRDLADIAGRYLASGLMEGR